MAKNSLIFLIAKKIERKESAVKMLKSQYDSNVTTWSPQGRLFQLEYAAEAVNQGSAIVGITGKTCGVLAAVKRRPHELGG